MSVSSLESLRLGSSYEQQTFDNALACLNAGLCYMDPTGMEDLDRLALLSENPSPTAFSTPSQQLHLASNQNFNAPQHPPESVFCTSRDDATINLQQITNNCARYQNTSMLESLYDPSFRQPQISFSSCQPQVSYMGNSVQAVDPRTYGLDGFQSTYHCGGVSDVASSCPTSPPFEHSPSVGWPSPEDVDLRGLPEPDFSLRHANDDDEDALCDKPYARLIYEALLQAPGHRMMLREIYEWFQRNTSKPRESGTNGWQNSIRHNLSMNQAFENDKSDPSNRGCHARKSNSVWILTDSAVQHGVQSTTRYRKSGSAKKANVNRVPAIQRQRSGAKGGQAARRAAKLRRREQSDCRRQHLPLQVQSTPTTFGYVDSYASTTETDYLSTYTPATPPDDALFAVSSALRSFSIDMQPFKLEDSYAESHDHHMQDLGFKASSDSYLEDMLRLHQD